MLVYLLWLVFVDVCQVYEHVKAHKNYDEVACKELGLVTWYKVREDYHKVCLGEQRDLVEELKSAHTRQVEWVSQPKDDKGCLAQPNCSHNLNVAPFLEHDQVNYCEPAEAKERKVDRHRNCTFSGPLTV